MAQVSCAQSKSRRFAPVEFVISRKDKIGLRKKQSPIESKVKEIKRATKRKFSAEEKIRIVLEGPRGEDSILGQCRREGTHPNLYYSWSKEFLEAGKMCLNGDTTHQATGL